jgi:subtilisin family serine protease
MATERNTTQWVHLWDDGSWIVALPEDQREPPHAPEWRLNLLNGLSDWFGSELSSAELWAFRDHLAGSMTLTFTHAPNPNGAPVGLEPGDNTEWFARVNLPPTGTPWAKLLGVEWLDRAIPLDLRMELATTQLRALEGTRMFEWVEPNLASPLAQEESEEQPEEEPTTGSRPPEWNQVVDAEKNRIRQIFTRINWDKAQDYLDSLPNASAGAQKAEIPVAVLDTGVDYQHSELEGRMFQNPLEIQGNGIDDDGNGFVDDFFGFDATVAKGQDPARVGSPGAADIGGAGSACPSNVPDGTSCGHGTHVAGIIAARPGGMMSLGICDSCKIFSIRASQRCRYPDTALRGGACVKATDSLPTDPSSESENAPYVANGKILDFDQVVGLNYLLRFTNPETGKLRIFIVNLSLGKYVYNRTMASVLDKLEQNGVLIVAAAGNDNTETPMFPAAYSSTLSVCATSEEPDTLEISQYGNDFESKDGGEPTRGVFAKTDFSNFGDWVDICAPGRRLPSTYPGNKITELSGTSQASPLVAGAAGYIWSALIAQQQNQGAGSENNKTIRTRLERFADPRGIYDPNLSKNRGYGDAIGGVTNYLLGSGMLDIHSALLTEAKGAKSSNVYDENLGGGRNDFRPGCIVSTVGLDPKAPWPLVDILTTMPFLLLQFVAVLWLNRIWRWQPKRR